MKLAIVVPVLNEATQLGERLQALAPLRARGVFVVVVDGGSDDGTLACAQAAGADRVLQAPRGRASQMNAGACVAAQWGAQALLFLHGDTQLPPQADALVLCALEGTAGWGRFDVRIEGRHVLLPWVAALMNRRSRATGIATGDQAMFVRRRWFEAVGGFAALPLMEDIDLSRRLLALGAPACLAERVSTSGRRWDRHGFWRTVTLMWWLRAVHWAGGDAHALAKRYGYQPRARAAVAVLAKAPVSGLAKTRLIPRLGAAGAARVQRVFTLQTLIVAHTASTGPITLWCAPDTSHRFFRVLSRRHGVRCAPQAVGDIGQRMAAAVHHHFAHQSTPPLLIVGTDCPVRGSHHLQQAADALQQHDVVLIPAEDGGYVLIGLRRPVPGVFEGIAWSTPQVMEQTRQRLRALGVPWCELPTLWDVDEPADWDRWQAQLL